MTSEVGPHHGSRGAAPQARTPSRRGTRHRTDIGGERSHRIAARRRSWRASSGRATRAAAAPRAAAV